MGLTTTSLGALRAVVDESSLERTHGAQIYWDNVSTTDADGNKIVAALTVMSKRADGALEPRSYSVTLTDVDVASNVATATLTAHGFSVGEQLYISGAGAAYVNGVKTIATVPNANTFTFTATGADASNVSGTIVASRVATELIETNAGEQSQSDSRSGYGTLVGGVLLENLLPDATGTPKVVPTQYKSELISASCTFKWRAYSDTRAD